VFGGMLAQSGDGGNEDDMVAIEWVEM